MEAVHATIFPFDGEGSLIIYIVKGHNDLFKVDVPMPKGAEVPKAAWISEVSVATEDAN